MGYRSLSLTPSAVGPVKATRSISTPLKVEALLRPLIDNNRASAPIRKHLEDFAAAEGLQL